MLSPDRINSAIKPNKKLYFISSRVLTNQSTNYYALKPNTDNEKSKRFDLLLQKNMKKRQELKDLDASLIKK